MVGLLTPAAAAASDRQHGISEKRVLPHACWLCLDMNEGQSNRATGRRGSGRGSGGVGNTAAAGPGAAEAGRRADQDRDQGQPWVQGLDERYSNQPCGRRVGMGAAGRRPVVGLAAWWQSRAVAAWANLAPSLPGRGPVGDFPIGVANQRPLVPHRAPSALPGKRPPPRLDQHRTQDAQACPLGPPPPQAAPSRPPPRALPGVCQTLPSRPVRLLCRHRVVPAPRPSAVRDAWIPSPRAVLHRCCAAASPSPPIASHRLPA